MTLILFTVKVGCPETNLRLSPDVCIKFLTETCTEGCTRYAAMEQCELSGGFLLELQDKAELTKLLNEISQTSYRTSFWWTGGIDIRFGRWLTSYYSNLFIIAARRPGSSSGSGPMPSWRCLSCGRTVAASAQLEIRTGLDTSVSSWDRQTPRPSPGSTTQTALRP